MRDVSSYTTLNSGLGPFAITVPKSFREPASSLAGDPHSSPALDNFSVQLSVRVHLSLLGSPFSPSSRLIRSSCSFRPVPRAETTSHFQDGLTSLGPRRRE